MALSPISQAEDDVSSGIQYQFTSDCFAAKRQGTSKYNINSKMANYNAKCDHEWALKQANSLNFVSMDYLERRLEKAQSGADLSNLKSSGVCLDSENQGVCVDRLKRELLTMRLKVRNETLKFNKTRADIAVDEGNTFIDGSEKIPETKKNFTILNDFYRASENQKKSKQIQKLLEPQQIDFSKDQSLEELQPKQFSKSNEVDVRDETMRKTMGLKDGQNLEAASPGEENLELKDKVEKAVSEKNPKKNVYSMKNYENDVKRKEDAVQALMKSKTKKSLNVESRSSVSVMSFIEVMDDLQSQAVGINPEKKQSQKSRTPSGGGLSEPGETSIYALPRVENKSQDKKSPDDGYIDYQIEKMLVNDVDPLAK